MQTNTINFKKTLLIAGIIIFIWLISFFLLRGTQVLTQLLQGSLVTNRDIELFIENTTSPGNIPMVGDEVVVKIQTTNMSSLGGKSFLGATTSLSFNPQIFAVKQVLTGSKWRASGYTVTEKREAGILTIATAGTNPIQFLPNTREEIFVVSFVAISETQSNQTATFVVSDMELADSNLDSIYPTQNSSVSINTVVGIGNIKDPFISNVSLNGNNLQIDGYLLSGTGGATILNIKLGNETIVSANPFTNNPPTGKQTINASLDLSKFPEGSYKLSIFYTNGTRVEKENAVTILTRSTTEFTVTKTQLFPDTIYKGDPNRFSVYVTAIHPLGVENIDSIKIDLSEVGITNLIKLTPDQIIDRDQVFVLSDFSLPNLTNIASKPSYTFRIVALDKFGKQATGAITTSLNIKKNEDRPRSLGAPIIDGTLSHISPTRVKPGENAKISVFVTDVDGVNDIENVIFIDDTELGLGTITLQTGSGAKIGIGQWYSKDVTIPSRALEKDYVFKVIASDKKSLSTDGKDTLTLKVSSSSNTPDIINDSNTTINITPNPVANNGEMEFNLSVFVIDKDGLEDVVVTADLTPLSIGIIDLKPELSTNKQGAWFRSQNYKVPTNVLEGNYKIKIKATDSSGASDNAEGTINVSEISRFQNRPEVVRGKSYTTPSSIPNDGVTQATIYAYVRDPDGISDIASVTVNLSEIGLPPTNSMIIVPNSIEGLGQYYSFSFTVPSTTQPSLEPYKALVTATDLSGAKSATLSEIDIKIISEGVGQALESPKATYAIATSETTVEVGFNPPLDIDSLSRTGSEFEITKTNDAGDFLSIIKSTVSADGTYVILETTNQEVNSSYTVRALPTVESVNGVKVSRGNGDKQNFFGFVKDKRSTNFAAALATGPRQIEVDFTIPVKPSATNLLNFSLNRQENTNERIRLTKFRVISPTRIILETESDLNFSSLYTLNGSNIVSYNGQRIINISINLRGFQEGMIGDLNKDGIVDFLDFSIFSSAYTGEKQPAPITPNTAP